MKTLILLFLFLMTLFVSCTNDNLDSESLEKKTNSYDVYVSGKENTQLCYWKNGIKHTISNNSLEYNPSKIFISGNDIYIKGRYGYWKNGNYTTYYQAANLTNQSGIDIFDFYMKNGNIYFVGYTWLINNPAPDKYEFCYWKNGVKTFLFKDSSTYNDQCTITEFNSDVYVGANKKISGTTTGGYFKNTAFQPLFNSVALPQKTFVVSNENNICFSSIYFYKNLLTGVETTFTPTTTTVNYTPALDANDVYINGGVDAYYKNANLITTFTLSKPIIKDLKVMDHNIYMIRTDPNDMEYKVYVNDVETQSIQNLNLGSSFNNITVIKN